MLLEQKIADNFTHLEFRVLETSLQEWFCRNRGLKLVSPATGFEDTAALRHKCPKPSPSAEMGSHEQEPRAWESSLLEASNAHEGTVEPEQGTGLHHVLLLQPRVHGHVGLRVSICLLHNVCAAHRGQDPHQLQQQLPPHLPQHWADVVSFSLWKRLKDENDVEFSPSNDVLYKFP